MKPTQLTLVIIKMAIKSVSDKLKLSLLTPQVLHEIKELTVYTQGRMNGIEKRLKESMESNYQIEPIS